MKKLMMFALVLLAVMASVQVVVELPPIDRPINPWEIPEPPTP